MCPNYMSLPGPAYFNYQNHENTVFPAGIVLDEVDEKVWYFSRLPFSVPEPHLFDYHLKELHESGCSVCQERRAEETRLAELRCQELDDCESCKSEDQYSIPDLEPIPGPTWNSSSEEDWDAEADYVPTELQNQ
jgi:hypothetical protein